MYNLVLLPVRSLDILAGKDRVVVDHTLLLTNMRLRVGIELGSLVCEVEVDGVHSMPGANVVGDESEDDRTNGTTAD
jgi:hypothetical protein